MSPRSPSYPFPRVTALSRPQPFSAFSTDTTIRSMRRTESERSVEMYTPNAEENVEVDVRDPDEEEETKAGLQRIFDLFGIQPASISPPCAARSLTSTHLPALTPSDSPSTGPISPLTLRTFAQEPPSPLSPFGTFALLDILSPLPSPDLKEDVEGLVSALVMEKFEEEEGFPWFAVEEGEVKKEGQGREAENSRTEGEDEEQREQEKNRGGNAQLDTPPTSPSTDRRPSESTHSSPLPFSNLATLPTPQRAPPPPSLSRQRASDDSWSPFPSTASGSSSLPSLPNSPPFTSSSSIPKTQRKTRLRRSTHTIASLFATRSKPILERGRSASLPATPTTSPAPTPVTHRERCCSIRRSLSRKKSAKSASRRPSQIRKSLISPPVPLPPLRLEVSTPHPLRPPPVSPLAQWRFPSSSVASTNTSSPPSSHIDPLFSSPSNTSCSTSTSICVTCSDTSEALKREQERGLALEGEVKRLRKVVAVLIGDGTGSDSRSITPN